MALRKIIVITATSITITLIALIFISVNEFFGTSSHYPKSPPPIMAYENSDPMSLGLKIIPIGCNKTDSGLIESEFQISNTSDNHYKAEVGILFTDNNSVLYEKEISITILAGQIINQSHLSDKTYDNPICVVQINDWSKV